MSARHALYALQTTPHRTQTNPDTHTHARTQQAEVLRTHTALEVGAFVGSQGTDFWARERWRSEIERHDVLVMTHQILYNLLCHGFITARACVSRVCMGVLPARGLLYGAPDSPKPALPRLHHGACV